MVFWFFFNLIWLLFDVATGTAVAVNGSFLFLYIYIYPSSNQQVSREEMVPVLAKRKPYEMAYYMTSSHTKSQPSSQVSAVTSSRRTPKPKDTILAWYLPILC